MLQKLVDVEVRENPVFERPGALLIEGMQAQRLDREPEAGVAVDAHAAFLRKGPQAIGLEEFNMTGPFPQITALSVIAPGRVAADINAAVVVEEIGAIAGQRDHRQ